MAKAYTIKVTGRAIKNAMPIKTPHHLDDNMQYNVCSECSSIVKHTWDHTERCSLFEQEALVAWVQMGLPDAE